MKKYFKNLWKAVIGKSFSKETGEVLYCDNCAWVSIDKTAALDKVYCRCYEKLLAAILTSDDYTGTQAPAYCKRYKPFAKEIFTHKYGDSIIKATCEE